MDRANYTDNGIGRYPLSTEGLEFIQNQIELIYNVAQLYGPNYILKPSTAMVEGVIVVNGEMMPLQGTKADYIAVTETSEPLTADGLVFENARVRRVAQYVASSTGEGCYEASQFPTITTIEAMRPHLTPKGAIVMWSGTTPPTGWALCDGTKGTPDLRGRFIVGYDPSDGDYNKIGDDGGKGKKTVTLKAEESGLPSHHHNFSSTLYKGSIIGNSLNFQTGKGGEDGELSNLTIKDCQARNAAKPHENRPPYYVLAYIMKTSEI